VTTATAQDRYRRHARRIRATLAHAPVTRMRALCELAHQHDAATGAGRRLAPAGPASTFAELVRERMDGPVLRYSHRTRLLREATRRGIGRFEANLIIAAVQHQAGEMRAVGSVAARSSSSSSWMPIVVGFVATQFTIVAGIWLAMR
jgi:hypothetical protein